MHRYNTISLIEVDMRRRAARTAALASGPLHVEPYESVAEFLANGNTETLIVVRDEGQNITDLLQDMRSRSYWAPILGYRKNPDIIRCSQLIVKGLTGYLPEPFDQSDIQTLFEGCAAELTSLINSRFAAAEARNKLNQLTPREKQVLDRLKDGLSNPEIAEVLNISSRTVEIHRGHLLHKLEAKNAAAAVHMTAQALMTG
ncbi:FixJ family two-component response regulator [Novosphingobium chloroacetimidivorans]|uniref:FixJ family two-component response regulator n=1 Tax=Novosphingobium chloroacetimidivorans TaxID=1428314 RepID=A0A7W7NYZ7_9SPHN|nr:LuxR C-terminal-related transcriptional regulator [Novosphingobium chloroacetimidivorans]MBB4860735.1 FixJ family two-component response regulator [Novosphingobium chloroacetimidivorans]